ncbi:MAG: AIR synthase-related protein [Nanoarchaeota archaeon]
MALEYHERESHAVAKIKEAIPSWLLKDKVGLSGMFADLHQNDSVFPKHYLASTTDSVGTKLIIAQALEKYDTVGIDLVALNVNDMATLGKVSPFLFINTMSCQEQIESKGITGELMKGIVKGLEQSDCTDILKQDIRLNMGKGETASVDELLGGIKSGHGFDLAASMVGFIRKEDMPRTEGDTLIALSSPGMQSNAFTELRHRLLKGDFESRDEFKKHYHGRFSLDDDHEGSTIGESLLIPSKIYMKSMAAIAKEFPVYGFNNTGYGLKNLNRLKKRFTITNFLKPHPLYDLVQKEAGFSDEVMYMKFNMGQGFFLMCNKADADPILSIAEKHGDSGAVIGTVEDGEGEVFVDAKGKKFVLRGYG